MTLVWAVGLVHDKVIDELDGVALTAVTGPGGASDLAGLDDEGDAEAVPAWNTTEVKTPARPIIHTVRTTTKRFIKTRFQSCSNPSRAT
jgi:hypothetical protein